jgi:hypothetical protein
MFGAHAGTGVQGRVAHVAQVVMQSLPERPFQAFEIVVLPVLFEAAQAVVDQFVVVEVGGERLLPLGVAF